MTTIRWNNEVKLIISDVDHTIADVYLPASGEMISELEQLLSEGKVLFPITGQSVRSMQWRITDHIRKDLRKSILLGHCSGAEVWGFDKTGRLMEKPFYSHYNSISDIQKKEWREKIQILVKEFRLKVLPAMPIDEFKKRSDNDPLCIMLEDRGPQITFEVVNGHDLSNEDAERLGIIDNDLRIPILKMSEKLLADLPITARLAGVFAIDFAIKGVSKTTAVKYIINNKPALYELGIESLQPRQIEVWGDKFSAIKGGTDRHMSEALPKAVRSITFREENPLEFPEGYNIVIWDGEKHLHDGLLEYLKSRQI